MDPCCRSMTIAFEKITVNRVLQSSRRRLRPRSSIAGPAVSSYRKEWRVVFFLVSLIAVLGGVVLFLSADQELPQPAQSQSRSVPVECPPTVEPEKVHYRFQDHLQGPYPFTYTPPMAPADLVDLLEEEIALGEYSVGRTTPLTADTRRPSAWAPAHLRELRWKVELRTYPYLLYALAKELPTAIAEPGIPTRLFDDARRACISEDAEATVGFSEILLRVVPPKQLPQALDQLAAAYWLAKEIDRLEALLAAGLDYRPIAANSVGLPTEVRDILASAAVPATIETQLKQALITGESELATDLLHRLDGTPKVQRTYAPLVRRLNRGLSASLDTARLEEQSRAIKNRLADLHRQLEDIQVPLHDRFREWDIKRLEQNLRWIVRALSAYSDPAADILAYMVEERGYQRLGVDSGVALAVGKRLAKRGEPARALPMFLLCQGLGYLSENGQFDQDGPNAMVAFNAFEAPIYFVRTVLGHNVPGDLIGILTERDDVYRVAWEMYEYSLAHCRDPRAAGIAGRPGYEAVALKNRWDFALQTGHANDVLQELETAMVTGNTGEIRSLAAVRLAGHRYRQGAYDKTADLCAALSIGEVHGRYSTYGLKKLQLVAEKTRNPKHVDRLRRTANRMLVRYRDDLSPADKEYIKRLTTYNLY